MKECELPQEYFEYLANILIEEPARNLQDIIFFIKDFMENNPSISQQQIEDIAKKIFELS